MDNCNEKEVIVRKRTGMFLEKLFHYFCDDFSHQRYKKIIYGEIPFESIPEEKFKSFYDGYIYLLNNAKNALTNNIISKFFYIIYGKEVMPDLVIRLSTGYFDCVSKTPLETACKFLLLCNKE